MGGKERRRAWGKGHWKRRGGGRGGKEGGVDMYSSQFLGEITDCWVLPSGQEYAHIKYADGDEEDVSLTKVRKGGREGGREGG